jgi:ATP-binding cassette subfamily F protein uup
MLAQRGADLTREQAKKPEAAKSDKATAPAVVQRPSKRRLMFKEKHALETLPKTIAELQSKIDDLQAKLGDPQFYARDRAAFEKTTSLLGELQLEIAAAQEQWLELEILREELADTR